MFAIYVIWGISSEGYFESYEYSSGGSRMILKKDIKDARLFPSYDAANAYCQVLRKEFSINYSEVIESNNLQNIQVDDSYED